MAVKTAEVQERLQLEAARLMKASVVERSRRTAFAHEYPEGTRQEMNHRA
jgi:hypothetical protein